jgi:chromosome segregation ATPase
MPDETKVDETTTTTTDAGASTSETGKDGQPFDAARAQSTIETLRAEIKGLKGTTKELDAAKARLKEIEDKDKSETEKLAAKATEASEKLTLAEARAQDLAIRLSVERAARKLSFIDEDDAYRLLDRKAVEMDDDGTPTNVEALLTALAKAKPHLVGQAETNGKATKAVPPTPKPAGAPTKEQEVDNLYQQMRATESAARW